MFLLYYFLISDMEEINSLHYSTRCSSFFHVQIFRSEGVKGLKISAMPNLILVDSKPPKKAERS
jgi:hypothetical protein